MGQGGTRIMKKKEKKGKKKNEKNIGTKLAFISTVIMIIVGIIDIINAPPNLFQGVIGAIESITRAFGKISIVDIQADDLSTAGIYLTPEESRVIASDNSMIYKKGCIQHVLIKNPKHINETIKECKLVITSIEKTEESNVVYFPVTFDDSIGIYAVNNGNVASDKNCVNLKSTFSDTFFRTGAEMESKTENSVGVSLQSGEAKEIYNYTFDALDKVFDGREENTGWLHIFAEIGDQKIMIGNITKAGSRYESFINQGGQAPAKAIPVYINYDKQDIEIRNNFPEISNNSTTVVDFMLLPDESVKIGFYFEIIFSNGDKAESPKETVNISVPIYEDEMDYQALIEYIKKSGSKELLYNKADFSDSSFIYDPEKLYNTYSNSSERDINFAQ